MDKALLQSVMVKNGDTQQDLADALDLSLSRFNAKINERDGATFTQLEIASIINRYQLSGHETVAIFFAPKVT